MPSCAHWARMSLTMHIAVEAHPTESKTGPHTKRPDKLAMLASAGYLLVRMAKVAVRVRCGDSVRGPPTEILKKRISNLRRTAISTGQGHGDSLQYSRHGGSCNCATG